MAFIFILPSVVFSASEQADIHPCRTTWNDKMKEYDDQYEEALEAVLFQKKRTSQIVNQEMISKNLRAHNCKMYQVCEVVRLSLFPNEQTSSDEITGKLFRCTPTTISEIGGPYETCQSDKVTTSNDAYLLWNKCLEQAEERISNVEVVTESEVVKSYQAKGASNFVEYLIELNKKLDRLALEIGSLVGKTIAATRKTTCVHPSCQ